MTGMHSFAQLRARVSHDAQAEALADETEYKAAKDSALALLSSPLPLGDARLSRDAAHERYCFRSRYLPVDQKP